MANFYTTFSSSVYTIYPGEKAFANYFDEIFMGYRHFDKHRIDPMFPFDYGLSYTTFEYSNLKLIK